MLPVRRPKAGETEEDLLRFQEEFLKSKTHSSASCVSNADHKRKSETDRDLVKMDDLPSNRPEEETPPVKKSRFRTNQTAKANKAEKRVEFLDPEEELEREDKSLAAIVTKIIERDTRNSQFCIPRETTQAFPTVMHRGQELMQQSDRKPGKKKSLFAQQISRSKPSDFGLMLKEEEMCLQESNILDDSSIQKDLEGKNLPIIVDGSGLSATFGKQEAVTIHQENLQKLSTMSEKEIFLEREKLMESLDSKLLDFLKSKKKSVEIMEQSNTKGHAADMSKGDNNSKAMNPIDIDQSELPVKVDASWMNMDKLECDKLYWMKELPPPVTKDAESGNTARFDLNGMLVLSDADIPVNVGLHHHGDEPERAGYSLEELFQLARSSNIQQRVLALTIMSKIFEKAKHGELDAVLQSPVLPAVIDAGVVFLLRWTLDDSIDTVMAAAVAALHGLLVSKADQDGLSQTYSWHMGHILPAMCPSQFSSSLHQEGDCNENRPQETDAEVLKRDLVLCLVERMNFLPRVHYILYKCRPQAKVVQQILEILINIVSHSTQLAYKVLQYQDLIKLIINEFLPLHWPVLDSHKPISTLYGLPVSSAMHMMRIISQAGRHCSSLLMAHNIKHRIFRYLADKTLKTMHEFGASLQMESLKLLKIHLLYGQSSELFLDMFQPIIEQLNQLNEKLNQGDIAPFEEAYYTELIGVLEAGIYCASSKPAKKVSFQEKSVLSDSPSEYIPSCINWSHVSGYVEPCMTTLSYLLNDVATHYQKKKQSLQVLSSLMNLLTTYFHQWSLIPGNNAVDCLNSIASYYTNKLEPCWKRIGFQVILSKLVQYSNLLSSKPRNQVESSPNLPYLSCSTQEDLQLPVLKQNTVYGFIVSLMRQLYIITTINKELHIKVISELDKMQDVKPYLKKISTSRKTHFHQNHFTKFENLVQFYFLKLICNPATEKTTVDECNWLSGLKLLTRLQSDDEYLANELLSSVIFSPLISITEEPSASAFADLKLSDATHLQSVTQEVIQYTNSQLLQKARADLGQIRDAYLKSLTDDKALAKSSHRYACCCFKVDKMMTSQFGESIFPQDWMFIPLIELYNKFLSVGADVQNALSCTEVGTVCGLLKFVFLLEKCLPDMMAQVSITLKISRIMCTFMTGNDLFLNREVHAYLASLLRLYIKPSLLDKMDFQESIPGLVSFYDFYTELLQQYEAVSFGDSLFGCYILLPLQQMHNIELRRAVWTEFTGIIRTLSLPLKESIIPLERFLEPEETDIELVRLYIRGLVTGQVQPKWSPILYLVAVHHGNRFIYTQDDKHTKLKLTLFKWILDSPNSIASDHLLTYKKANLEEMFGIEKYEELPPLRLRLLEVVKSQLQSEAN